MRTADLFRIDTTNGTIIEHWAVVDSLNLLRQTGVITFNQPDQTGAKESSPVSST